MSDTIIDVFKPFVAFKVVLILLFVFLTERVRPQSAVDTSSSIENELPSVQQFFEKGLESGDGSFDFYFEEKKLYLKLHPMDLNKAFLLVRDRVGYKTLQFNKREDQIWLVAPQIKSLTGSTINPYSDAYHIGKKECPIVATFPIMAVGDDSLIIEITALFVQGFPGIPGFGAIINTDRSFIENAWGTPNSIELNVMQTETLGNNLQPVTYSSHWSLFSLPEKPMKPRRFDPRMGYFMDTGSGSNYKFKNVAAISRWRLEKKDSMAKISEPIRPIIFYLDTDIPEKWKPYVKAGILSWIPAFEEAGFKNALEVLPVPDTTNWDDGEMGRSYVRWSDRSRERDFRRPRLNADGGGTANWVIDERSGEILKGDIVISSPLDLLRDNYFIRAAAIDPRASNFPYPDTLMGKLIESLIAHEAGHAFGIKDGHYGEFAYPFEEMQSEDWLRRMGHTPSIMNYTREHNLLQDPSGFSIELVEQKVGPADIHNIVWAYSVFPKASPKEELMILDSIVQLENKRPWLRYARSEEDFGPYAKNEVADNDQPVGSAHIAIANLKKELVMLPMAALTKDSDNYLLEHLYYRVLDQWVFEMEHVSSLIGGFRMQYKSGGQPGVIYEGLSKNAQKKAISYLNYEAFKTPDWLIRSDITRRFEPRGTITNIGSIQSEVLDDLLDSDRIFRLVEIEATSQKSDVVYTIKEFLKDLNEGIWSELEQRKPYIDIFRQELQQSYLRIIEKLLDGENKIRNISDRVLAKNQLSAYSKGQVIQSLEILRNKISKGLSNADSNSRGHLLLMENAIDVLLKKGHP